MIICFNLQLIPDYPAVASGEFWHGALRCRPGTQCAVCQTYNRSCKDRQAILIADLDIYRAPIEAAG